MCDLIAAVLKARSMDPLFLRSTKSEKLLVILRYPLFFHYADVCSDGTKATGVDKTGTLAGIKAMPTNFSSNYCILYAMNSQKKPDLFTNFLG